MDIEQSPGVKLYANIVTLLPAKVVTDRVSDKSKGFGFVTYASVDEAEKAMAEMNGKVKPWIPFLSFPFLYLVFYFYVVVSEITVIYY